MAHKTLPADLLDLVLKHLVVESNCLSTLSGSKHKLLLPGCRGDIYDDGLWHRIGENAPSPPTGIFAFLALSRYWRRQSLAVIFQRIMISDSQGLDDRQGFIDRFGASRILKNGLCALDHIQHLSYGSIDDDLTQGEWSYDIEDHPWLTFKEEQSDQQWSLQKEIDLASSFFELLPTTLRSLYWRSPLPTEGTIAEKLQRLNLKDVFISSVSFYVGTSCSW
jgi:hypothetical protein